MDIGIGLPCHAGWTDGRVFVEWARRAEARGFSSISVSDRLLWSTPEPLTLLAAVAGATERIRLQTSVLLAPLRANHLLLAKSVLTLDQIAGSGRLRLGLAPGFREEDFRAGQVTYSTRGPLLDAMVGCLESAFRGEAGLGITPATPGGPPILFGGRSAAAVRRVVTGGTGWLAGTSAPNELDDFIPTLRRAWAQQGRAGQPSIVASTMFALGPDAEASVRRAIGSYYEFAGPEWVNEGISAALTSEDQIASAVAEYIDHGCDELVFSGNDTDPDQVDILADAIGLPS